jgi:hypothetical protein
MGFRFKIWNLCGFGKLAETLKPMKDEKKKENVHLKCCGSH